MVLSRAELRPKFERGISYEAKHLVVLKSFVNRNLEFAVFLVDKSPAQFYKQVCGYEMRPVEMFEVYDLSKDFDKQADVHGRR